MTLTPYRETLALRGIRSLLIVATLGRIPITAGTVTLTLHVVLDLKLGYGAAGLAGAMFTIGGSLGAPVMGRITDRRGLRPVLLLTTIAEVTFWGTAQALPYAALLVAALIGGFLTLPVFSVARQSIAALAPESHRLPAFALDSMTTELSFMAGPALGVFVATTAGPRVGMLAVGIGILLSGIALYLVNPPIRGKDEAPITAADRVPRRTWLRPRLLGVLGITVAATLVLSGTDVAVVAILRSTGEISWVGLVLAIWAAYSLLGGFLYGMIRRGLPPVALLLPMAVLTIPVGLAGGHWWLLAILLLPAGALCAPTITATADAVSRLTPASARGEAMGLHNSSLTVGVAVGAPLAGTVMDTFSPAWGFTAVGTVGLLMSLVVIPSELRRRRRTKAAAARSQATKAVAAQTLAAQTLAAKTLAAKTLAARTVARNTVAAQAQATPPPPDDAEATPPRADQAAAAPRQAERAVATPPQADFVTTAPVQADSATAAPPGADPASDAPLEAAQATTAPLEADYVTTAPLGADPATAAPLEAAQAEATRTLVQSVLSGGADQDPPTEIAPDSTALPTPAKPAPATPAPAKPGSPRPINADDDQTSVSPRTEHSLVTARPDQAPPGGGIVREQRRQRDRQPGLASSTGTAAPGQTPAPRPTARAAQQTPASSGGQQSPASSAGSVDPASSGNGVAKPGVSPSPRKARASRPAAPAVGAAPALPAASHAQTSPTGTAAPRKPSPQKAPSRSGSGVAGGGERVSPTSGTPGSRAAPTPRRGRQSRPADPAPTDS